MGSSGGITGGLKYSVVATGATLTPNSYNVVSSGGSGNVDLPSSPPAGSVVFVKNTQTINNGAVVVVPAGASLIEGSAGLGLRCNLNATGTSCYLLYDGTNWEIISIEPDTFPVLLSPGGYGTSVMGPSTVMWVPRTTAGANVNLTFNFGSSVPLPLAAGASNIDFSLATPHFSAGVFELVAVSIALSQAASGATLPVNRLVLQTSPGAALASGTTYSPGAGGAIPIPTLDAWTTEESAGTDLVLHAGNTQIDSTAGYDYWYQAKVTFRTASLVP